MFLSVTVIFCSLPPFLGIYLLPSSCHSYLHIFILGGSWFSSWELALRSCSSTLKLSNLPFFLEKDPWSLLFNPPLLGTYFLLSSCHSYLHLFILGGSWFSSWGLALSVPRFRCFAPVSDPGSLFQVHYSRFITPGPDSGSLHQVQIQVHYSRSRFRSITTGPDSGSLHQVQIQVHYSRSRFITPGPGPGSLHQVQVQVHYTRSRFRFITPGPDSGSLPQV